MTFKEIQELLKFLNKSDITEFRMKEEGFELQIRTKYFDKARKEQNKGPAAQMPAAIVQPPPVAAVTRPPAEQEAPPVPQAEDNAGAAVGYKEIRSPMVGTFYRSPTPEKGPYVKVGDVIEIGTVVCIVEAMKLFNEIESEIAGKIVKVMIEDAQPVEYDQVLFLVDPKG